VDAGQTGVNWNTLDKETDTSNPMVASHQTSVRQSMVTDGVGTIFVSEQIDGNNGQGSLVSINGYIQNPNQILQNATSISSGNSFQNGLINFLFVDGHAEAMIPAKTLNSTNVALTTMSGMWTILAGD
jgi:prepilin-type processing-associated H-X9-DG protein